MPRKVKYYGFQPFTIVTALIALVVTGLYFYSVVVNDQRSTQRKIIADQLVEKQHLINSMVTQIGYGHFIHNFKNLVIRKDSKYLYLAIDDYQKYIALIDQYLTLENTQTEQDAITAISEVIDLYWEKLDFLSDADFYSITSSELDALVKIDDRPAQLALSKLFKTNANAISNYFAQSALQERDHFTSILFGIAMLVVVLMYAISNIINIRKSSLAERKQSEARLYLETIMDNASGAIIVLDTNGVIIRSNKVIEDITGFSAEEILNQNVEMLVPHKFRSQHINQRNHSVAHKTNRSVKMGNELDLKILRKDGSESEVEISNSHIEVDSKPVVVSVINDISEERRRTLALQRTERFLTMSQHVADYGSWYWDFESEEVTWSEHALDIYGLSHEQLGISFKSIFQYVHPDDRSEFADAIQRTLVMKDKFEHEYRLIDSDGKIRIVQEVGRPFVDENNNVIALLGTVKNITAEHKNTQALKMAEAVFSNSNDAIIVTDSDQNVLRANLAFYELFGYDESTIVGYRPQDIWKSDKHDKTFYQKMWEKLNIKGHWAGEIWDRKKSGNLFLSAQFIYRNTDKKTDQVQYISIIRDITKQREDEEQLRRRAYYDALTQLPNRSLFSDRLGVKLNKVKRKESEFALVFMDLDGFKAINDRYGHDAGDSVLKTIADRLIALTRDSDTVSRLAGDEFTIILDDIATKEAASLVVEKILTHVNKPIFHQQDQLNVGASFGVVLVSADNIKTQSELMANADEAMYTSKQLGKNQATFYAHFKN